MSTNSEAVSFLTSSPLNPLKRSLGVFTSGGDSPGMNAVIRAAVRYGIYHGFDVYAIHEGYQGMIDGGKSIKKMNWMDVSMIMHLGGTVIGTARCKEFRERSGHLIAAENLIKRGIHYLLCCGGDGSLTGANRFRLNWPGLVEELLETGKITREEADSCRHLFIAGLVGSIDNDLVFDGELTIGVDTALTRIVESTDAVCTTASSHQRTFVIEVMGRHCGFLAWGSAVSCGADFVFIPEAPHDDDWAKKLCDELTRRRNHGRRLNIVIVAEGAVDNQGNPITVDIIQEKLISTGFDTRTAVLGHVQRGGRPSGYDRLMATLTTASAVEWLANCTPDLEPIIVGMRGFRMIHAPMMQSIANTLKVVEAYKNLDFATAMKSRGDNFVKDYKCLQVINGTHPGVCEEFVSVKANIGIINVGAPASGMNAAVRAATRFALNLGMKIIAFNDGFRGMCGNDAVVLKWMDVDGWTCLGGSKLGTNRIRPSTKRDIEAVINTMKLQSLKALIVVGGFEAFLSVLALSKFSKEYPELNIPIIHIPATVSNNCPGTEYSIGCDTGINMVTDAIDKCKMCDESTGHRVFIIETQGKYCGHLAAMGALASGANIVYSWEEGVTIKKILSDIRSIERNAQNNSKFSVVVRSEKCHESIDLGFMEKIYHEEGENFTVRTCKLDHMCQGMYPSPLDRIRATKLASAAVFLISELLSKDTFGHRVVGFEDGNIINTDVILLESKVDLKRRKTIYHPFEKYIPLVSNFGNFPAANKKKNYNF